MTLLTALSSFSDLPSDGSDGPKHWTPLCAAHDNQGTLYMVCGDSTAGALRVVVLCTAKDGSKWSYPLCLKWCSEEGSAVCCALAVGETLLLGGSEGEVALYTLRLPSTPGLGPPSFPLPAHRATLVFVLPSPTPVVHAACSTVRLFCTPGRPFSPSVLYLTLGSKAVLSTPWASITQCIRACLDGTPSSSAPQFSTWALNGTHRSLASMACTNPLPTTLFQAANPTFFSNARVCEGGGVNGEKEEEERGEDGEELKNGDGGGGNGGGSKEGAENVRERGVRGVGGGGSSTAASCMDTLITGGQLPPLASYRAPLQAPTNGISHLAASVGVALRKTLSNFTWGWLGGTGGGQGSEVHVPGMSGGGVGGGGGGGGGEVVTFPPNPPLPPLPPRYTLSLDFSVPDSERCVTQVLPDPTGRLILTCDTWGRVMLVDAGELTIQRLWKGYRDATLGWMCVRVGGRASMCPVILAPRRGILEVWRTRTGPRVASIKVPSNASLVYSVDWEGGGAFPTPTCTLITNDGNGKCLSLHRVSV